MKSVGVIGLGNISIRHRKNLQSLFPRADVIAMSASGRRLDSLVEFSNQVVNTVEELINLEPSFVIVASPAPCHLEHAVELIKNNIPVLIEKPVTTSSFDAEKLLRLEKQYNTAITVGYCLRYLPSARKVWDLLSQNVIGTVYNVFVNVGQYLPYWRAGKNYKESVSACEALGGGALFELSHEIDYIQWLLGDMSLEYAYLRSSLELALDVEDSADLVLSNSAGTVCSIHLDFLQKSAQRKCSFIGSNGRLEWDLVNNSVELITEGKSQVLYQDTLWDKNQMYIEMINDFVACINDEPHSCITTLEASKTVELIELIKKEGKRGISI
jgi:predicted dehydrogenase